MLFSKCFHILIAELQFDALENSTSLPLGQKYSNTHSKSRIPKLVISVSTLYRCKIPQYLRERSFLQGTSAWNQTGWINKALMLYCENGTWQRRRQGRLLRCHSLLSCSRESQTSPERQSSISQRKQLPVWLLSIF